MQTNHLFIKISILLCVPFLTIAFTSKTSTSSLERRKLPSDCECFVLRSRLDESEYPQTSILGAVNKETQKLPSISRRRAIETLTMIATTAPLSAKAACLSGDTNSDCIGVYKVPIDDDTLPYFQTPELLAKSAPGMRWVPPVTRPKTYAEAISELKRIRSRMSNNNSEDEVGRLILGGKLEEGGKVLLGMIPRVTVAGRVVVSKLEDACNDATFAYDKVVAAEAASSTASSTASVTSDDSATADTWTAPTSAAQKRAKSIAILTSMRAEQAESAFFQLLATLYQSDILIGQGIRGDLGATAVAQIQILSTLKEAGPEFDDFLAYAPSPDDAIASPKSKLKLFE